MLIILCTYRALQQNENKWLQYREKGGGHLLDTTTTYSHIGHNFLETKPPYDQGDPCLLQILIFLNNILEEHKIL